MAVKTAHVVKVKESNDDILRKNLKNYFGTAPFTSVRLTGSARAPGRPVSSARASVGPRAPSSRGGAADADLVFTTVTKPNALHIQYDKALQHSNPARQRPKSSLAPSSRVYSARASSARYQQQQSRSRSARLHETERPSGQSDAVTGSREYVRSASSSGRYGSDERPMRVQQHNRPLTAPHSKATIRSVEDAIAARSSTNCPASSRLSSSAKARSTESSVVQSSDAIEISHLRRSANGATFSSSEATTTKLESPERRVYRRVGVDATAPTDDPSAPVNDNCSIHRVPVGQSDGISFEINAQRGAHASGRTMSGRSRAARLSQWLDMRVDEAIAILPKENHERHTTANGDTAAGTARQNEAANASATQWSPVNHNLLAVNAPVLAILRDVDRVARQELGEQLSVSCREHAVTLTKIQELSGMIASADCLASLARQRCELLSEVELINETKNDAADRHADEMRTISDALREAESRVEFEATGRRLAEKAGKRMMQQVVSLKVRVDIHTLPEPYQVERLTDADRAGTAMLLLSWRIGFTSYRFEHHSCHHYHDRRISTDLSLIHERT